jgi:hypothetical protein
MVYLIKLSLFVDATTKLITVMTISAGIEVTGWNIRGKKSVMQNCSKNS